MSDTASSAREFRRDLHRHPELSGEERGTAARVQEFLTPLAPDLLLQGLGGTGLAAAFDGGRPGPTVLLRCELDALPIQEAPGLPYGSVVPGISHKCGHDGHAAILAEVATRLARHRPARGRACLLFQPAEETGQGARAVLEDPRFPEIAPDHAFALHNVPGLPIGKVVSRAGAFACASRGVIVGLQGIPAHAAQPETGRSPARALRLLLEALEDLRETAGIDVEEKTVFATVVGARLGGGAFGTTPGDAELRATLRSETEGTMGRIIDEFGSLITRIAHSEELEHDLAYEEVFPATVNSEEGFRILQRVVGDDLVLAPRPFRWSEDFGRFLSICPGAMFALGAGEDSPELHRPEYDFPDELISRGADLFLRILEECLA